MKKKNLNLMRVRSGKWLLLFAIGLVSMRAIAQPFNVNGVVTGAEDGMPIPGVSVVVKGTVIGTITDMDGKYRIKAENGNVLVFSFIGMQSQEVIVSKRKHDVKLKMDLVSLDEVVAIGYGTQKKKEVSGAVVQVKSEDLEKISTSDLGTALQGAIAGVSIQASSGQPGANSNIQIRGVNSITGANAPLFVVDGIPQEGNPQLSSSEIASVDVLKDAASSAIYGVRGAGGVVLITTKTGKAGEMKISANAYYGIQKITSGIDLMSFEDYWYQFMVFQNQLTPGSYSDLIWTSLENGRQNFTNNTSIVDVIEQDNAKIQNYSVNISGGKKDLTYNVVGSFFEQDGTLINTGYERFNVRANTSYKKGRWTIKTSLGFKVDEQQYASGNLLYEAYKFKPYQRSVDPDAVSFSDSGTQTDQLQVGNVMAKLKQTDVRNGESFNGNVDLKFELSKGLYLTGRAGVNYGNNTRVKINPLFEVYDTDGELVINANTRSGVKNTSDRSVRSTFEAGVNYTKKWGEHQINFLAVASSEEFEYTTFYGQGKDITSNEVAVLEQTTAEPSIGSGSDKTRTLVGLLGRVQYNYKGGRYNLSVSARRDGSSKFASGYQWEIFPSVSASWNVADEPFWEGMSNTINGFKIRASLGTVGNNNIPDYQYAATISSGFDYPFGADANPYLALGQIQTGYANPNVFWETSKQTNVGVDLGLLDNRLSFNADFYNTEKVDLLFPLLVPTGAGAGENQNVYLNIGDMNNKGIELASSFRQHGKFSWNVGATFTRNVNEVKKMHNSNPISYFSNGNVISVSGNNDKLTVIAEGYEAGAFMVMETNGIINTEEKLAEYQKIESGAKMGDLIYVDQNGDKVLDESDRVYGGSGTPDFEVGLNMGCDYKGFDFSMQWFGAYGQEVINGSKIYAYTTGTHKDLLYQWSDDNPLGVIPSNRSGSHDNYRGYADIWVEDGSFIRLRNVTLGYSLPKQIIHKMGISKLRLYVATDNPITLTKYSGYDPEVGGDGLATRGLDKGNYPISSQYRAGIQMNF
ncbi:SusC/RagA family TonB-linked outer membrane protein [Saccharicrinis fermentans]|uniref:Outer membrane cobalamin receptor protein n=1 Tax=Saccharicrinis fermentans DSM 9555 = JCM 21142 TaxID=869213 RepID=W7Y7L4_9BACT|nr:TonB-dependent receptor [Saccharicrinis fermentans]GAF03643.1 outer membrane cobalamin receptor protein [Saccharicrinis fermentans DSM 9555 = JCM 21142]